MPKIASPESTKEPLPDDGLTFWPDVRQASFFEPSYFRYEGTLAIAGVKSGLGPLRIYIRFAVSRRQKGRIITYVRQSCR